MEKNTIILDELGNEIGRTYPKRARGLVKNGRAEQVNDCTIRLCKAQTSTMIYDDEENEFFTSKNCDENISTENSTDNEESMVIDMSKIITFNARDFRLDKTYEGSNDATRMFITDMFGESTEIYEISEDTRIFTDKTLEPNEDGIFRFALAGNYSDTSEVLQLIIVPASGEEITDEDWENKYIYNLSQCQYKPSLNKRWENSSVRIYEVPFKTEESGKVRILFLEKNSVARIMPAKDNAAYAQFPEYTMSGWINEKKEQFGKIKDIDINIDVDQTVRDLSGTFKSAVEKMKSVVPNFTIVNNKSTQANNCSHVNEVLDGNELAVILNKVTSGMNVDFSNSNISDVENLIDCGTNVSGCNFNASNSSIGGKSFCGILQKVGDGCNLDLVNAKIGSVEGEVPEIYRSVCGCNINMINTDISEAAFAYLMKTFGDGCDLEIHNVDIIEDGSDCDFGSSFNGTKLNVSNTTMSDKIKEKLRAKIGMGCNVFGL